MPFKGDSEALSITCEERAAQPLDVSSHHCCLHLQPANNQGGARLAASLSQLQLAAIRTLLPGDVVE